jgi:hypothetical protein
VAWAMNPSKRNGNNRQEKKYSSVKNKINSYRINEENVQVIKASGTKGKGGDHGGEYWIIIAWGKRAGKAYINIVDDPARGPHPSFHIFLNKQSQGRRVGSYAYKKCCEASSYDTIYAHMRKSNIASIKSAKFAGFTDATTPCDNQYVMVWNR